MEQGVAPDQVATVLNHFVSVRILSEREDSGQYELRHDSLAQKIFERMSALERDLLEVMQMVENRYKEYQTRGTFLDHAALDYVTPYQSHLRFTPQLAEFISASRRELTRARRKKRTVLFVTAIAIFIVVSGLGLVSYLSYLTSEEQRKIAISLQQEAEKQRKRAEQQTEIAQQHLHQSKLNEIVALNQTSKLLSLAHDELGALLAGVKAGLNTTQTNVPAPLKNRTFFNLHNLVEGVQEKNRLESHKLPVMSVAFSPDGTRLASGDGDGTITLWHGVDGRKLFTVRGHTNRVNSVAFSPDGILLASGGGDHTIKLWQAVDGQEITTLHGHVGYVQSVAFSPDGTWLAWGTDDKTIALWQFDLGEVVMRGCEWLQGYVKTNPNVSDTDRVVCDEVLQ